MLYHVSPEQFDGIAAAMQMQLGYAPMDLHYDMCPAATLASPTTCEVSERDVSDATVELLALPKPHLGAQVAAPCLTGYVMT